MWWYYDREVLNMEYVLHCIALHLAPHHFILMQCFVFHSYFRSYCHTYTIYACVCPFNPIHSIARVISLFTFQLRLLLLFFGVSQRRHIIPIFVCTKFHSVHFSAWLLLISCFHIDFVHCTAFALFVWFHLSELVYSSHYMPLVGCWETWHWLLITESKRKLQASIECLSD